MRPYSGGFFLSFRPFLFQSISAYAAGMLMLSLMALSLAGARPASPTAALEPAKAVTPNAAEAPAAPDKRVYVELLTDAGRMVIRLETERAPITTGNFLRYVDSKRMDGFQFYRTTRSWGPSNQIIQAGNRGDARLNYPPIAHEPTNQTGLTHCKGALSMARMEPGSATTDFFLLLSPILGFDADPARSGDNAGFAVFGELVEGAEVAEVIFGAPTSATEGQGVMLGQMLEKKVAIRTAKRIAAPAIVPQTCVVKAEAEAAKALKGEAE